jgi:hypothetical protein
MQMMEMMLMLFVHWFFAGAKKCGFGGISKEWLRFLFELRGLRE